MPLGTVTVSETVHENMSSPTSKRPQEHATRAAIRKEAQRQRVRAKVPWQGRDGYGEKVKDARVQGCSKIPHRLALARARVLFQLWTYLDYVRDTLDQLPGLCSIYHHTTFSTCVKSPFLNIIRSQSSGLNMISPLLVSFFPVCFQQVPCHLLLVVMYFHVFSHSFLAFRPGSSGYNCWNGRSSVKRRPPRRWMGREKYAAWNGISLKKSGGLMESEIDEIII